MTRNSNTQPCPVLCILLREYSLNLPAHIGSDADAERWMQEHASNELEWMRRVSEEIRQVSTRRDYNEPFDLNNPLSYEELREFYITINGLKE